MVDDSLIDEACECIEKDDRLHITRDGLEMVMDKIVPYVILYRYEDKPDRIISQLLRTQPGYFIVSHESDIEELLACIAPVISEKFNAFLILELVPIEKEAKIQITCRSGDLEPTLDILKSHLKTFASSHHQLDLEVERPEDDIIEPPIDYQKQKERSILWIALGLPNWFGYGANSFQYPLLFREFKKHFSVTLKKTAFEFIRVQATNSYSHYQVFGRTQIDPVAEKMDKMLADISGQISFLLNITPVNDQQAWEEFDQCNYEETPFLGYRLIPFDPEDLKKQLFSLDIEEVNDPTLSMLLRDKRLELEKMLLLLESRETENFKYISQSLFGAPSARLVKIAKTILEDVSTESQDDSKRIDCHRFLKEAKKDLKYYQSQFEDTTIDAVIRDDIVGIMVDKSQLFISNTLNISKARMPALIQHEVGTHILTYCNGRRQPLRQMYAGLAGYDELQEGLAVLSEYLVGGLTSSRLRLLAGRVIAVDALVKGKSFPETFKTLCYDYDFSKSTAFKITIRVYRGGGLTKDAVYLKGLVDLIKHLQDGGDLELLFSGKFNLTHLPLIEDLAYREILAKPVLPKHFNDESVQANLKALTSKTFKITHLIKDPS